MDRRCCQSIERITPFKEPTPLDAEMPFGKSENTRKSSFFVILPLIHSVILPRRSEQSLQALELLPFVNQHADKLSDEKEAMCWRVDSSG